MSFFGWPWGSNPRKKRRHGRISSDSEFQFRMRPSRRQIHSSHGTSRQKRSGHRSSKKYLQLSTVQIAPSSWFTLSKNPTLANSVYAGVIRHPRDRETQQHSESGKPRDTAYTMARGYLPSSVDKKKHCRARRRAKQKSWRKGASKKEDAKKKNSICAQGSSCGGNSAQEPRVPRLGDNIGPHMYIPLLDQNTAKERRIMNGMD